MPLILCCIIAGLTVFYKLDAIRTKMTVVLESRREEMRLGESVKGN